MSNQTRQQGFLQGFPENCLKVTYVTLYICSLLLLVSPRALAMLVNLTAKFSKLRNCMAGGYPKDKG